MKKTLFLICGIVYALILNAQPVFIDEPVQAGDLLLFRHISDTSSYYYLPNKLALGTRKDGGPQFSFLRYVQNEKTSSGSESINEAEGGGILHALIELKIPEKELIRARQELTEITGNDEVIIRGPMIYSGGTFSLVSSFANEGSDLTNKVIGVGQAPVFVGNKAAVSLSLTKLGSKILWQSCQTPTPDLSFSFVMDLEGYRSPMQARIEVDWDKIYTHEEFSAGIQLNTGYVGLGADISAAFDELREDGTIKVVNFGADEKMEQLIDIAYKKLADMMFAPFSMPNSGEDDESWVDDLVGGVTDLARAGNLVNLNFAYEMKEERKSGNYVIDLSKATKETFSFRFDENLGSDIKDCIECFKQVNLDDPFYKQREVLVSVDGLNSDQFAKYINFVTVSMRKDHGDGKSTVDEIRIAEKEFTEALGNPFRLLYGWKDESDNNRQEWLSYNYKTTWSFFGDHSVQGEWRETDQVGLNLAPPFHPVKVSVEADPEMLKDAKIRIATVKFYYDYGAGEKVERITIKGNQEIPAELAEFMLKQGHYDYEYEIHWRLFGNKKLTTGRKKTSDTLLYVDEIPEDAIVLE